MLKAAQYQKGLNITLSSAFLRCHRTFEIFTNDIIHLSICDILTAGK